MNETQASSDVRQDGEPDVELMELAPELGQRLAALGIPTRTVRHPEVRTVEESQALRGRIEGGHTKNLFLKDKKGRIFLVVVGEATRIDLKTLHGVIGGQGRLSFADADRMRALLGVEPGSVTAFGIVNDRGRQVTLVLDEALLAHDILNCHPLTNRATTSIARSDLLALASATGHDPLIVPLSTGGHEPESERS